MYSPKIREELIPEIYQAAKGAKLAMTAWVNRALEQALRADSQQPNQENERTEVEVSVGDVQ